MPRTAQDDNSTRPNEKGSPPTPKEDKKLSTPIDAEALAKAMKSWMNSSSPRAEENRKETKSNTQPTRVCLTAQ